MADPSGEIDPSYPSGMRPSAPVRSGAVPCSAHKSNGDPCGQPATGGTNVCDYHGARAPQVRKAARRRVVNAQAAKELKGLEYEPVDNPVEVLQDLAGKASAIAELIAAKAADADDTASIEALGAALDRAHKFAESLQRLGLDERRLKLEEAQARVMWAALQRSMDAVGLPTAQQAQLIEGFEVAYAELEKANSEGPK